LVHSIGRHERERRGDFLKIRQQDGGRAYFFKNLRAASVFNDDLSNEPNLLTDAPLTLSPVSSPPPPPPPAPGGKLKKKKKKKRYEGGCVVFLG
jgi:hypothetical protein